MLFVLITVVLRLVDRSLLLDSLLSLDMAFKGLFDFDHIPKEINMFVLLSLN